MSVQNREKRRRQAKCARLGIKAILFPHAGTTPKNNRAAPKEPPGIFDICARPHRPGPPAAKLNHRQSDIDWHALAYLPGRKLEDVLTVRKAVKAYANSVTSGPSAYFERRAPNPEWFRKKFLSEHFELVGYKKGTLHMTFRDKDLWERFNIEAAKGKNWIPDNYRHTEQAVNKGVIVLYGRAQ